MCAFFFFQMGQLLMKNSSIFRMLCDIAIFGSRKQSSVQCLSFLQTNEHSLDMIDSQMCLWFEK